MELNERINLRGAVDAWAKIAIERFHESLKKRKIGISQSLFNSFAYQLKLAGGDVEAVILKFNFYGRLRDMGVGRGVSAHEVKSNKANLIAAKRYGADVSYTRRQVKRWYPKTKTAQVLRLKEILIEKMGIDLVNGLEEGLSGEIRLQV